MSANPTPTSNPVLLAMCDRLASGLHLLETEIGIKQHTEAKLRADIAHVMAMSGAMGLAKITLMNARKTYRGADAKGERVIAGCRMRLAQMFGSRHNVWWEGAGFSHRTTAVPEVAAVRMSLLSYLAVYFKANPDKESADMGATAANCKATFEALSDARSAVNRAKGAQIAAVKAVRMAYKQLRSRFRGVIQEMGIVLPEDDARWLTFGLKLPARTSMPEPVSGVEGQLNADGDLLLSWPAASHARRYRVQVRLAAMETIFRNVKTVKDTSCLLSRARTANQVIEVRVIAANRAGEAAASEVVRFGG